MTHPLTGRKQSAEHIAKRVAALRAAGVYLGNAKRVTELNRERAGIKHTETHKARISAAMKGKRNSAGASRSLGYRKHLSDYWKDNPDHNHWVDGKSAERSSARVKDMGRLEYRLWRQAVFKRDKYTCVQCGQVGGKLNADHILPYSTHEALRYDIRNGRTLCLSCHVTSPTYAGRARRAARETIAA